MKKIRGGKKSALDKFKLYYESVEFEPFKYRTHDYSLVAGLGRRLAMAMRFFAKRLQAVYRAVIRYISDIADIF